MSASKQPMLTKTNSAGCDHHKKVRPHRHRQAFDSRRSPHFPKAQDFRDTTLGYLENFLILVRKTKETKRLGE